MEHARLPRPTTATELYLAATLAALERIETTLSASVDELRQLRVPRELPQPFGEEVELREPEAQQLPMPAKGRGGKRKG